MPSENSNNWKYMLAYGNHFQFWFLIHLVVAISFYTSYRILVLYSNV